MASDNLPTPQSYEQLLADALSAYAAKIGIDDFNIGSAVTSFFEVVALTTARASGDVFQILRDFSVDRATGDALQRLALENNVQPKTAQPATGLISVTDTSFVKISTKIYAGLTPPNIGSTTINVSDASQFPSSGSVYIGRGTPNVEGPIPYAVPPVQVGNYWQITLSTPTTKFHNLSESVILAQGGNRSVPAGTIVISPAVGANPDIQYTVTTIGVILDGEVVVNNVPVNALLPGASGNVPIGAVKQFVSPPFAGATVTNPLAFTTGQDTETDDQLRVRIKRALASVGLGTATAIKSAVIGATAPDENATIVSASIVQMSNGAILYIDDGSIYEAKSAGVGLESIVDSALGGEQFFQLATGGTQAPVAKAFLQSNLSSPFDLVGGDTLAVIVGGQTYQHVFQTSDFRSPGSATAFEITASINADTLLGFEATTAGSGTFVVIRAKTEGNDTIQITTPMTSGRDAAVQLGFSSSQIQTLRLFKNNIPLSKDGATATVFTQDQSLWSNTIADGDTLILSVDGTDPITYTIHDADFIATELYNTVSATNSLESWVEVFNNKLTGVTAEVVGQQISITSNLNANNRAAVVIDPSSTLVSKAMFTAILGLSSQGKASDYTLSRNTAQFELTIPLAAGDKLAAGSEETEARIQSGAIPSGSVDFASDAYLWILTDTPGTIIPTALAGNSLLAVSKPSTNVVRYTSTVSNAFANVQLGDYVIIWSTDVAAPDRLEGRVHAVTADTLDILVTASEWAAIVTTPGVVFVQGFTVLRSALAPQKFKLSAGIQTLDQIAANLQAQTPSLIFSVLREEFLIVRTRTKDSSGSVLIVTADVQGQQLQLPLGVSDSSKDSLIAFYDTQEFEAQMPLFIHAGFSSDASASPPDSFISSLVSSISLSGRDPNELLSILHPYGASKDAQPRGEFVQESTVTGANVTIGEEPILRRLRTVDRYFLANPLDFGAKDTAVVIMDNNPSTNSFEIPLFRVATTNTSVASNPTQFNAYDTAAGATASFASSFGASFDFSNFKMLMQAKKTLKPTPSQTALLYRAVQWGRSGEFINVGYSYPSVPNAPISSTIVVNDDVTILINLASAAPIATAIDPTTEWNISITPNTPSAGIDQVTYTWNGTGTAPALSLSGGEYVNITTQTEFDPANTGVFRVSTQVGFTPTATSFSVQRPNGVAVAQMNVATLVNGAITFYAASPTTAAQINTYVNANLSAYVTSTIVNDGGMSGSGVIVLSTYEDSGFVSPTVQLVDGINWILSSNLGGSPQFTLKKPLSLPTDVGYAFNNGEAVRLNPTTTDQVKRFTSVLAVSGITTVGTINQVDRATRIEIATDTLGSDGSVQIIGGLANGYEVPILDSASRVDNQLASASANIVAAQGVQSDQWFKLQASTQQAKESDFSNNTDITLLGNSPIFGQSTIQLLNRQLTQRYFGKPRNHVRSQGRTFKIEKQGALVCLSWNPNSSTSPVFMKSTVNFNDSGGGTINVAKISGTNDIQIIVLTGNANFNELSIGDLVTISGLPVAGNNGTFLVTGISDDGKTMQVFDPNGANEFSSGTFTFGANPNPGDSFVVSSTTLIAGTDFVIGATPSDTATNFSAVVGTIAGVSSVANGTVVTVTATSPSAIVAISYTGAAAITVSGAFLAGISITPGSTFTASISISEGDTVVLSSPFNILNQGQFRVIRRYNDSVWFENPNVFEEEVTLPYNPISLGFDATTSFKVNASSHTQYVNWNGIGTEPSLENAQMGDVTAFGGDFNIANQGQFMVLRSGPKLQEITNFVMPPGSQFTLSAPGQYFLVNSAGDVNLYYVWFNVNGTNTDPAVGGRVGLQVNILNGDNSSVVAANAAAIVGVATGLTASSLGNVLTVTTTGYIETTDASNFNMPSPFSVSVQQQGRRAFVECINPSAVNESSVLVTGSILQDHRPQLQFSEYDATVSGDSFVITNSAFLTANIGSYSIQRVIDRDTAIVVGSLGNIANVSLNGIVGSAFVQERFAYTGYKRVLFVSGQPGAPTRSLITFDTNAQSDKINQSAGVQMISLGKLDFSTIIKNGLDSYRYNTGLIAEANRIIYGDPRDAVTYPGVGAAGAEIFVHEPLARRIQVSLDIRLNTGVPFIQSVEQVRTSVSSLINSNPIGQSIAISSIIAAVSTIPGILAVSIDFPNYSPTNDLIVLSPSEKAVIIDPTIDISVSQVGS